MNIVVKILLALAIALGLGFLVQQIINRFANES